MESPTEPETEAHPLARFAGIFEDDREFDEFMAAIQDHRRMVEFMDNHDTIPLEIPVRVTETPTGCRAESFGVVVEAEDVGESLRRLQARLFQLFLDGAVIARSNSPE